MLLWRFKVYVSPGGKSDVQQEVDRYDVGDLMRFQRAVAHLAVSTKEQWNEPHAKKLKGKFSLYEVRYKADKCQTRALGFFGPDSDEFTITKICDHKGNVYRPPNAFETAANRADQITSGQATTAPLQVDGEEFPEDG